MSRLRSPRYTQSLSVHRLCWMALAATLAVAQTGCIVTDCYIVNSDDFFFTVPGEPQSLRITIDSDRESGHAVQLFPHPEGEVTSFPDWLLIDGFPGTLFDLFVTGPEDNNQASFDLTVQRTPGMDPGIYETFIRVMVDRFATEDDEASCPDSVVRVQFEVFEDTPITFSTIEPQALVLWDDQPAAGVTITANASDILQLEYEVLDVPVTVMAPAMELDDTITIQIAATDFSQSLTGRVVFRLPSPGGVILFVRSVNVAIIGGEPADSPLFRLSVQSVELSPSRTSANLVLRSELGLPAAVSAVVSDPGIQVEPQSAAVELFEFFTVRALQFPAETTTHTVEFTADDYPLSATLQVTVQPGGPPDPEPTPGEFAFIVPSIGSANDFNFTVNGVVLSPAGRPVVAGTASGVTFPFRAVGFLAEPADSKGVLNFATEITDVLNPADPADVRIEGLTAVGGGYFLHGSLRNSNGDFRGYLYRTGTSGAMMWAASPDPGFAPGVNWSFHDALDMGGAFLILGTRFAPDARDVFIIEVDDTGELTNFSNLALPNIGAEALGFAPGPNGILYVAAANIGATEPSGLLIITQPNGGVPVTHEVDTFNVISGALVQSVAPLASGNAAIAGSSVDFNTGHSDIFLMEVTPANTEVWSRVVPIPGFNVSVARVRENAAAQWIVGGQSYTRFEKGNPDAFLAGHLVLLDLDPVTIVRSRRFGLGSSNFFNDFTLGPQNFVTAAGTTSAPETGQPPPQNETSRAYLVQTTLEP